MSAREVAFEAVYVLESNHPLTVTVLRPRDRTEGYVLDIKPPSPVPFRLTANDARRIGGAFIAVADRLDEYEAAMARIEKKGAPTQ